MTASTIPLVQYVTQKGLDEDQLQMILRKLLDNSLIPPNPAIDNILKTYDEFERQPNKQIRNLKYDLNLGKVVQGPITRLNFALSHIGVLSERNELYFILDNSKIICVYNYVDTVSAEEIFIFLSSIMDEYNIMPLLNPEEAELLEITGVPELQ